MKTIFYYLILALLCLNFNNSRAQSQEENIKKYWNYRDRLRKDFLKVGNDPGESIPMSARSIGFAYSGAPEDEHGNKASRIYYQDATIYLGHYLAVLATEIKLLENNNNTTHDAGEQQTIHKQLVVAKRELYYAIQALNRIDQRAEEYLSQEQNIETPDDINGLLMRDDVHSLFHLNFESDYSEIFGRDCNFILTHSDYKPVEIWGNANYQPGEQIQFNNRNIMSLDQITTVFTGLRCVYDLVEDEVIQPTPDDAPMNLRQEARAIVHRILNRVVKEETAPGSDPAYSFTIREYDGRMTVAGLDLSGAAPFLYSIGKHFSFPLFNQWDQSGLQNIRIAIMLDSPEFKQKVEESDWFPCKNELIDRLIEKGNSPINIATIPFNQLLILIDEIQQQQLPLITGGADICLEMSYEIEEAIDEFDFDIQGMACDNIVETTLSIMALSVAALAAVTSTIATGETLVFDDAEDFIFSAVLLTLKMHSVIEEDHLCIAQLSGSGGFHALSEDNVHIMQELGTISGRWSAQYINSIDHPSGLDYYTMLRAVLEPGGPAVSLLNQEYIRTEFIDTAPCEGPWADPNFEGDYENSMYCAPNNWASENRLFHANNRQFGPDERSFRGEFSGLDYMLYYNLYHLLWAENLPAYTKSISCMCTEECTTLSESTSALEIIRKFPDYKAKGIPIESYLTHDFTAHTPEAILEVRNDLIICSPHQGEVVELTLRDGASMNLYNGNKIVVNSGNVLTLRDGSVLNAGLDDTTYDGDNNSYPAPEIFLEENAKMIVQNYSSIKIYDGLRIHLKPGSEFHITDGDCSPMGEWGITFISDGGTITMDRSTVVARSNFSTGTHLTNTSVQIDKSTLSIPENSSNFWIADNCNIEFFSSSNLNLSTLFQVNGGKLVNYTNNVFNLKGGFLELNDDAKFYWNGGQFFLQQNHSYLRFNDSEFHLAPNTTFEPKHEDFESGYIEFSNSYDVNFFSGDGSAFILRGDGEDDLMLKINHSANLWNASSSNGDLIFENCKVDLSDHGGIWIGQRFKAIDVNFIDLVTTYEYLGGNIHVWYNDCSIKECYLDGVRIHGHDSKMYFMQSQFKNKASGIESRSGSYKIDFCGFESCHVESYSLELASSISNSLFQYSDYAQVDCSGCSPFVFDESSVDLRIAQSTFRDGRSAVTKYGGKLSLRCNWFKDLSNDAVKMAAGYLNMSTTSAAGYNIFENVRSCLKLDFAEGVDLYNGYNNLSGFIINCIYGTMNKICIGSCETTVDATRNYWGAPINIFPPNVQTSGLYTPDMTPVVIDVYGSDGPAICYQILCTSGCPGCKINFKDYNPTWRACGIDKPIVREKKSMVIENNPDPSLKQSPGNGAVGQLRSETYEVGNPLINTASFNDVLLDSALVYAALQMELYDSLGNDLVAVDLFNEILTSPLDRTNSDIRWRMEWGRYNMKIALENMFTDNELLESNNTESFEYPVQQYVDVLNIMTDSILTDSTYKEQFYLEIDKGQLFRTLGNPQMARYVYTHLDDCDLDSLEQARLNNWLAEVDLEISIRQQYVDDELSPDSISYAVDSSGYTPAVPLELSDFYFGLWINSPQSVTFVACGGNPVYRSVQTVSSGMAIYPNPTSEGFFITTNEPGNYTLRITDMFGRLIYERQQYFEADTPVNVDRQDLLSGGQYLITLSNHERTMKQKLIVN